MVTWECTRERLLNGKLLYSSLCGRHLIAGNEQYWQKLLNEFDILCKRVTLNAYEKKKLYKEEKCIAIKFPDLRRDSVR